ncbi:hypothetical protein U9M48_040012 [Paspalum notatum var. saurae]|uniref:Uncharacterized protein n=1 Tax=Paspalum notatum var. saurae TaxID=547442 RepID=A0AAQ3UMH6_PASNO
MPPGHRAAASSDFQAYKATGLDNPLNNKANQDSFDSEISQSQFSKAGFFSKMSFWWMNPLLKRAMRGLSKKKMYPFWVLQTKQAPNTHCL